VERIDCAEIDGMVPEVRRRVALLQHAAFSASRFRCRSRASTSRTWPSGSRCAQRAL
jgi:hypothetical protein